MQHIVEHLGVESILHAMGIGTLSDKGRYFLFSSPFRDDKNPSMVAYKQDGYCVDFGGTFSGPISRLYKEVSGRSIIDDFGFEGASGFDVSFQHKLRSIQKDAIDSQGFPNKENLEIKVQGKIKYDLRDDPEVYRYCLSRGLTIDFRNEFQIGFTDTPLYLNGDKMEKRLLIPIVENEKIISYEARDYTRTSEKKVLYPKGGSVSTLFNIDHLDRNKPLVVVEGIMDMPKIWSRITKNVTTTFGIQLTGRQRTLLKEFKKIILFPDGDDGGRRFIENIDKILDYEFEVAWIEGSDPGEASLEETEKAYNERKPVTRFLIDKMEAFGCCVSDW